MIWINELAERLRKRIANANVSVVDQPDGTTVVWVSTGPLGDDDGETSMHIVFNEEVDATVDMVADEGGEKERVLFEEGEEWWSLDSTNIKRFANAIVAVWEENLPKALQGATA